MFTAGKVRDLLELKNDRSTILALRLNKLSNIDAAKEFVYDTPYVGIYKEISYILSKFREMPQGMGRRMTGLTVSQLGYVLDKMVEPWPDAWIAIAIRYQLLAVSCKDYSIKEIMQMKFANLDKGVT